MKKKFDIVLVATKRPEILQLTLCSFKKKFLDILPEVYEPRLIVNIDPIGEMDYTQVDLLNMCYKFFDNIKYNLPKEPSFSKAVQWCWEQVESDIFLHLEDDWILKKHLQYTKVSHAFIDKSVVSLRLNLKQNPCGVLCNGTPLNNGLSLNPTFFRKSFIKQLLKRFDAKLDPEKQFKNIFKYYEDNKMLFYGKCCEKKYVIDSGKKWRKLVGYSKWNNINNSSIAWEKNIYNSTISWRLKLVKYKFFILIWNVLYCKRLALSIKTPKV